jgi:hypothetical protein
MEDQDIEDIITNTTRQVKGYCSKDKIIEDSNDLNWIESFLAKESHPVNNKQPEPSLRWAKREMSRRITDSDFRDRFSDTPSETSESRTEKSFKEALRKITLSYTRSLKLVK